jgi:hypothetical protein
MDGYNGTVFAYGMTVRLILLTRFVRAVRLAKENGGKLTRSVCV